MPTRITNGLPLVASLLSLPLSQSCVTDIGGVTAFKGNMMHRGEGITGGERYIVACFLYAEEIGGQE